PTGGRRRVGSTESVKRSACPLIARRVHVLNPDSEDWRPGSSCSAHGPILTSRQSHSCELLPICHSPRPNRGRAMPLGHNPLCKESRRALTIGRNCGPIRGSVEGCCGGIRIFICG